MRLLLVEASGRGFLSHYTHALAEGMFRAGAEVQLLTGKRDELRDWWVPFHKQACLKNGSAGWRCIRHKVITFRPDVVHLQWVNAPVSALRFVRWAQRRGVRVIYTPHNILPHERRWLSMPLYRLLYRSVDRVVARDAHLAWALEELLDMPRRQVAFLPGSPNYLAQQTMENESLSPVLTKAEGEHRLLFFGHGCPRKGLDRLLTVVSQNSWPDRMHLVVAGEGVLRGVSPELAAAAKRAMHISVIDRYVAPQEVAALFRDADLLLMPYIKLCKSPLLDLAASLRLPVLRSDRVQGADFREGVHGATYAHEDTAALCRLLTQTEWMDGVLGGLSMLGDPVEAMDRLAEGHKRLYEEAVFRCANGTGMASDRLSTVPNSG